MKRLSEEERHTAKLLSNRIELNLTNNIGLLSIVESKHVLDQNQLLSIHQSK